MGHSLRWVKWARVGVALISLYVLTGAFLNLRGIIPGRFIHPFAVVQFIPSAVALFAGAFVSFVGVVILTLLFGRVYCSTICPLGILQDVIARLGKFLLRRKNSFLRYTPPHTILRQLFFWIAVATIPFGSAGLAIAWLDPYSNFGRIISMLIRPVLFLGNNALVPFANKWGWSVPYHIDIARGSVLLLSLVAGFFLVILVMAALGERLYCNTVCPVGTLLGFISSHACFKFKIAADACGKCARCLKSCKAQCIDLKAGTIDSSRCVACFNCIDSCERDAMLFTPDWKFLSGKTDSKTSFDPSRRSFLLGTSGTLLAAGAFALPLILRADSPNSTPSGKAKKFPRVITPPTSRDVEDFLARCTACQLCISECTTSVLQPSVFEYSSADLLKPHMDFSRAFCNYDCHHCLMVCPTGALVPLPLAQKQVTRIGVSHFNKKNCIVETNNTDCAACSEHCPTKAVHTIPYRNGLFLPEVTEALCIGCGACEYACPARPKAITVEGLEHHSVAERAHEAKAANPSPQSGFPF